LKEHIWFIGGVYYVEWGEWSESVA